MAAVAAGTEAEERVNETFLLLHFLETDCPEQ